MNALLPAKPGETPGFAKSVLGNYQEKNTMNLP